MEFRPLTSGQRPSVRSLALLTTAVAVVFGCASPGPPRQPSLQIPVAVTSLSAERTAGTVHLAMPIPQRSTDRIPLRTGTYRGTLCRAVESGPCLAISTFTAEVDTGPGAATNSSHGGTRETLSLSDALPTELTSGRPRLLSYHVEIFSPSGASAGKSDPAFAAAGAAPLPVTGLQATGSRAGAVLNWVPTAAPPLPETGEVILSRQSLSPTAAKPRTQGVLWFSANSAAHPGVTLDSTIFPATEYRYSAVRISRITLAGHPLELRSEPSAPVDITFGKNYPPAMPSGLTAAVFADAGPPATFAVDLIWEPVSDPGPETHTAAPLAGYLVYRETLDPAPLPRTRLTATPVSTPAFHDATARPDTRYRYAVSAIDRDGNESTAASVVVQP